MRPITIEPMGSMRVTLEIYRAFVTVKVIVNFGNTTDEETISTVDGVSARFTFSSHESRLNYYRPLIKTSFRGRGGAAWPRQISNFMAR